jgi:hypothetical protein
MKGKSAEVLKLIKSLSSSEKKAFRKASTTKGAKEYLALFNLYDLSNNITERQLELKFGKNKLPTLKNYLYQNLLNWLVEQDVVEGAVPDFYKLVKTIQVLEARGMADGALKLLERNKVFYMEHQFFLETLVLVRLKLRLLSLSVWGDMEREVQHTLEEEDVLLLNMVKQNKTEQSMNQIRDTVANRTPALRKKLLSELKTIDKLPGYGQNQYLDFYKAYIQKNPEKLRFALGDILKKVRTHKVRDPLALKSFFELCLMALQLFGNKNDFQFIHQLLSQMPVNELTIEYKRSFMALAHVYFRLHGVSGKEMALPQMSSTDPLLSLLHAENLYYSSLAYLEEADFENALKLQVIIINNPAFSAFTELQVYTRVINLISNFDAENYSIVGYLHHQTLFYINRCGKLFDFEIQFMNYMRLVRRFKSNEEKVAFYATVLNRLDALRVAGSEPLAYRFDFSKWLHRKMNEPL